MTNQTRDLVGDRLRWIVQNTEENGTFSQAVGALIDLQLQRRKAARTLVVVTVVQMIFGVLVSSAIAIIALGCTTTIEIAERHACDTESSSGGSSSESSSTGAAPMSCPVITDGDVAFDLPVSAVTRYVRFANVSSATGAGPLSIYWHGTYESIPSVQTYNPVTDLQTMVVAEGGVLALPFPDMMAQADGEPFPWWIVCGAAGTGCDRDDDFELAAAVMGCAVEQGLVDADRLVESGMSAGGIQTSHRIASEDRLAGVVVWSGGVPPADRPTVPAGDPSVFVLHGGVTDTYCGAGAPPGCHSFVEPNEALAGDVGATITCNHGYGHSASMGAQGAEFLARSTLGVTHPWAGFPVGAGGWSSWPGMSSGSIWVLRNDCDPFP